MLYRQIIKAVIYIILHHPSIISHYHQPSYCHHHPGTLPAAASETKNRTTAIDASANISPDRPATKRSYAIPIPTIRETRPRRWAAARTAGAGARSRKFPTGVRVGGWEAGTLNCCPTRRKTPTLRRQWWRIGRRNRPPGRCSRPLSWPGTRSSRRRRSRRSFDVGRGFASGRTGTDRVRRRTEDGPAMPDRRRGRCLLPCRSILFPVQVVCSVSCRCRATRPLASRRLLHWRSFLSRASPSMVRAYSLNTDPTPPAQTLCKAGCAPCRTAR
mmetsp:Transcript_26054/g.44420  ORF Transcript_26054/g.44420 Transcript_26054/m.44420 type:complete len:272 (-) Transcript_26054:218-1033(-)